MESRSFPELPADLRVPTTATTAKYGITLEEWIDHLTWKDGVPVCPICERPLTKAVTDHKHVAGWKHMPPEERKLYVRGIVCIACNHWVLTRFANSLRHRNAAEYLDSFERRFEAWRTQSSEQ